MTSSRAKRTSQADIAREANVAVSTVSRALGNAQGISPEIRDRVRRLAAKLGYADNNRPATGGAVIYLPMHPVTGGLHQVSQEILKGIQAAAEEEDIPLYPLLIPEDYVDVACVLRESARNDTNAAMMLYMTPKPGVADHFRQNGTLVMVNNIDPDMRFDSVIANNYAGTKLGTQQAILNGHRSILFLAGNLRFSPRERLRGFNDAIAENPGVKGDWMHIGFDRLETAHDHFTRYFAENRPRDWTAMICANDLMAMGVMQAAKEYGLSVPEDFSIIGFDNIDWSGMVSPRLATINVDREAMGAEAIRLLKARMLRPDAVPFQSVQGVTYVPGGTIRDISAPAA